MSRSSSPISTGASVAGVVQPSPRETETETEAPHLSPQFARMLLLELKLQEERLNHGRRTEYGKRSSSVPGCCWRRPCTGGGGTQARSAAAGGGEESAAAQARPAAGGHAEVGESAGVRYKVDRQD
ncbi:uncharacterized protein LOC119352546 [Triticum dicoccoides]|uniref:uncharacterized protein LOC119266118 n=1 Tax=Triticum dicoccoides TaxID=85692 RepID=UPI00188E1F2D|nr:uncharacterized protein LOC119266118 [Triticum dicoccoides]XP_037475037.1 uncharacterized protein LOC119352546 [Triticum dicoccoides]